MKQPTSWQLVSQIKWRYDALWCCTWHGNGHCFTKGPTNLSNFRFGDNKAYIWWLVEKPYRFKASFLPKKKIILRKMRLMLITSPQSDSSLLDIKSLFLNSPRFTEAQMRMPRGWLSCVTPRRSRSSWAAPGTTCTCASRATSGGTDGASAPPSRPCVEVRHGL